MFAVPAPADGAMMQTFYGEDQIHIPSGYLANDKLHKIQVTPVFAGKTGEKTFAGFFKCKDKHAKYLANLEDDDPTNDDKYTVYKDVASYLSQNTFQPVWTFGRNLKVNASVLVLCVM